jgi:hypothetical protein
MPAKDETIMIAATTRARTRKLFLFPRRDRRRLRLKSITTHQTKDCFMTSTNLRKVLETEFDSPDVVSRVIDVLHRSGIVKPEIDKLHAASIDSVNSLGRTARNTAARIGLDISASGEIGLAQLNARLVGFTVAERLRLKTLFASAGLIK